MASIPRRHLRLAVVFACICLSFTILPSILPGRPPRTWTVESTVHHKDATTEHQSPYALVPFPDSPLQPHRPAAARKTRQPWLAAIICAAQDVERRMLMRASWIRLFRHVPVDARFVVANPGPSWGGIIQFENQTFGDVIVLDHIPEDDITANTIKTLEFYKLLLQSGHRYEFITKLDTDLWINAPAFWHRYLVPRMTNETGQLAASVNRTVIGQLFFSDTGYNTFAHGSMYTITWDMMQLLVSLQERFNIVTGEDAAVGILMHKGQEMANFVNMRGEEKFDYDDGDSRGDGTAWARAGTHPDARAHALYSDGVIAVHLLKQTRLWLKVAQCFDEEGIKPMPEQQQTEKTPPLHISFNDFLYATGLSNPYKTMFETIPQEFLVHRMGQWICDGIWNLGKSRTGFQ
ncbi:uncharacterized protein UV8b_04503 [Ustilaginoidea virens]|uniref:Hexosyltransferase n=1 Tax=Ustilaginoidea virens TaxID=1159556 RepID=A0A063BQR8_USTVR|nr:uncharacterized protein UV8b_04503 [Ustilaginoidea virens]QUC20262.1 hypothetical protein UV8b_04503 [Ustilaginoidea virens]GAO19848.1 hypothetical protein UVI_02062900 [Ustilaginoidea virens]